MKKETTSVRVRYKETDQMGVAYYSNYLVWFEVARAELFRKIGYAYRGIEEDMGLMLMVVEASCRYKLPARYDDLLNVDCCLKKLGSSSLTFGYTVRRKGNVLAEGETAHVFVDKTGRPKRIPSNIREALR